jgi:hypothetical protein
MDDTSISNCEFDFFRFMGRHRKYFTNTIIQTISEEGDIDWLDHYFTMISENHDHQDTGIRFLHRLGFDYHAIKKEYKKLVRDIHKQPTWDAIGQTTSGTIILVKAISGIKENLSNNQGKKFNGITGLLGKILGYLLQEMDVECYGEYINRLIAVWFLNQNNIPATFVEAFTLRDCQSKDEFSHKQKEWKNGIIERNKCLGIENGQFVANHVFKVLLPTDGSPIDSL